MLNKKITFGSLAGLMSMWILASPAVPGAPYRAVAAGFAADPCAPSVDGGGKSPTPPRPEPPQNLRVIRGSGELEEPLFDNHEEPYPSGPFVWPEVVEPAATLDAVTYFSKLINRAECLTSFNFRSQTNIDLVRSRSESDAKIPIVYDPVHEAAKFEIDPSGSLPHSGSTGTPQKWLPINAEGTTSLLITWEMKIAKSMMWKPTTEKRVIDGKQTTVKYLDQHKSHRLDTKGGSPWIGMKQNYSKAGNRGLGVAEFFFSAQPKFMGPGTSRGSSEIITPVLNEFYVQPDTWTRVWVYIEGNIGTGDNLVKLSAWLADEKRGPVRLYDKVNMITPQDGIGLFRFEFDSSLKVALNGPGQQYQRNFAVLKGMRETDVIGLLEKPVK